MRSVLSQRTALLTRRRHRAKGSALIEVSLMAPWILFLFVGIFDMGFYTYSMIAVENAARVAAEYTSGNWGIAADQSGACARVLRELASLPNASSMPSTCNAAPLTVTADRTLTGPDGNPATSVSVTYRSNRLIPIPGLLMGQLNITRNVQMRVKP